MSSHLKPARDHFGPMRALAVTGKTIDRYIESCQAAELAPATINRRLQLLSAAFRLGLRAGPRR